jgi:hypothetical protein
MKPYPGKCRICKCDLLLKIDDWYDVERDSHKLLGMAACNTCFDFRRRRIRMEEHIRKLAHFLSLDQNNSPKRTLAVESLGLVAKRFSSWCADVLRRKHTANSGRLAARLEEEPQNWFRILGDFENEANES